MALAVTEFAAGISNGRSFVVAVGDWTINHASHALVDFGKRNFGTNDKSALVFGIVVVSLLSARHWASSHAGCSRLAFLRRAPIATRAMRRWL